MSIFEGESAHLAAWAAPRKGRPAGCERDEASGEEQAEDTTGTTGAASRPKGRALLEGPMLGGERRDDRLFARMFSGVRGVASAAEEWSVNRNSSFGECYFSAFSPTSATVTAPSGKRAVISSVPPSAST